MTAPGNDAAMMAPDMDSLRGKAVTADERVLILADVPRDADLTRELIMSAGMPAAVCTDIGHLCRSVAKGAGAAVIGEECLDEPAIAALRHTLAGQPRWSDFPIIVLTRPSGGRWGWSQAQAADVLGNVSLVDRPVHPHTLASVVNVALRARRRQYALRDHLREREATEELLRQATRRTTNILESISDAFIAVDRHWRITYVNGEAGRILRRRPSELVGRDQWTHWPFIAGSPLEDALRATMDDGRPRHLEQYLARFSLWLELHVYPARDGISVFFRDVTARKNKEEENRMLVETLAVQQSRLEAVIHQMPSGLVLAEAPSGRIVLSNDRAADLLGHPLGETPDIDAYAGFGAEHPDGRRFDAREHPLARALENGELIEQEEVAYRRPDGSLVYLSVNATPVRDGFGEGRIVGAVATFDDVTERREAAEHQQLLLDELNHRVKNVLATVQSVAAQTLRRSDDMATFGRTFLGRLQALAASHTLVTRGGWKSTDLRQLAEVALRPYRRPGSASVTIEGPVVAVPPKAATRLGMALHELATNAAKYGALSVGRGRVEVTWSLVGEGAERELHLVWAERGGPRVKPPQRQGFGRNLIERSIAYELDGTASLEFPPEGVRCRIVIPSAPRDSITAGPLKVRE